MIKHVVCFKLKEGESAVKASEVLLSMKGKVPEIIDITVGVDLLHSSRSYDVILEVVVKDFKNLESYQKDKYHCEVVKPYMHRARETSVAVDFEI